MGLDLLRKPLTHVAGVSGAVDPRVALNLLEPKKIVRKRKRETEQREPAPVPELGNREAEAEVEVEVQVNEPQEVPETTEPALESHDSVLDEYKKISDQVQAADELRPQPDLVFEAVGPGEEERESQGNLPSQHAPAARDPNAAALDRLFVRDDALRRLPLLFLYVSFPSAV